MTGYKNEENVSARKIKNLEGSKFFRVKIFSKFKNFLGFQIFKDSKFFRVRIFFKVKIFLRFINFLGFKFF